MKSPRGARYNEPHSVIGPNSAAGLRWWLSSRVFLLVVSVAFTSACHGTVGPAQATPPLDSLELSGVPTAGTVGDRFPLKVIATNLHGATEDVTSRVIWSSTSEATAAVSREGELVLVGAGKCEIRASIEGVSTGTPVSVDPRPPDRSTLSGSVTDSVSRRGITNATVQVLDGPNAGRSASTDESGFYSLPALIQGSFTVRVTRSGYETAEATTTLAGDTPLDFPDARVAPAAVYRSDIRRQGCRDAKPMRHQSAVVWAPRALRHSAAPDDPRDTGREEREYPGSLESDGTFSGSTGLAGIASNGSDSQAHGVSTIKGLILESTVTGTEKLASHLCPNGLGIVTVNFSGSN